MTRYLIVDFMHLGHKFFNGHSSPLTAVVVGADGKLMEVNTTLPNDIIKSLYRMSQRGNNPILVCLEGGCPSRKEHFKGEGNGGLTYKSERKSPRGAFAQGINLTQGLMYEGKIPMVRQEGYEADDLIAAAVKHIKRTDTHTPIDIVTNDHDLMPLVDNQVSVYMRATRTYSEFGAPEFNKYYQITPNSWGDFCYYSSRYKDYDVPYNSIILWKLIKGDAADSIAAPIKGYGKRKYSELIQRMRDDGVRFDEVFRYGKNFEQDLKPTLSAYFDAEVLAKMEYIYRGIDFIPAELSVSPAPINIGALMAVLSRYQIHLVQ